MNANLPAQFSMILLFLLAPCGASPKPKEYKAKSGTRVVVLPAGKSSSRNDFESNLEFYSPKNQMLCSLDYSSEDGEHGFRVVKAAWTPDSNYFVFSLSSSGGHQPWHAPTLFYSTRDNTVRSLDRYTNAPGISSGGFSLQAPNVVLTEVWRDQQSVSTSFRLDSLTSDKPSQYVLHCVNGAHIKAEP